MRSYLSSVKIPEAVGINRGLRVLEDLIMQEAKETGERVVNDLCDAVRYLGDVSYAILPKDVAHNLADLKKSFLKICAP